MADDIKSILTTYLPQTVIGVPNTDYILEYIEYQDLDTIQYGIAIEEFSSDFEGKSWYNADLERLGDLFVITCIADTKAKVDTFITAILKSSRVTTGHTGFSGNNTYSSIDPQLQTIERNNDPNWKYAKFPILCVKTQEVVYT